METTATQEATSPDVFNVLDFVEKTAYPVEFVTLFTDIVTAREYTELKEEWSNRVESTSPEEEDAHEAELDALVAKLKETSLTFKLRGFPPGIVNDLIEKNADDDNPSGADAHVISRAIVSVTRGDGQVDAHAWSPEEVERLRANIAEGQYMKLLGATANVVFNAGVFDKVTDAGFPGGSSDLATEL